MLPVKYHRGVIVNADGWLAGARRAPSPNQDARPHPDDISLVIVHGISLPPGEFGNSAVEALFCNQLDCSTDPRLADLEGLRVSAHALIDRAGAVAQFVPFSRRAWHAGASSYRGRGRCNDFAIGIELEGTDAMPYEDAQYAALGEVLRALLVRYSRIDAQAIVGHSEVAPGRKTDPGPHLNWRRVLAEVLTVA